MSPPTANLVSLRRRARVLQGILVIAVLLIWESGIRHAWLASVIPSPAFWFSSPDAIATLLWKLAVSGRLASHIGLTLSATLLGLAIGACLGTLVGAMMASSRTLEHVFEPLWAGLNAVPKIALAPALGAAFGLGIASKVALAVTLVFFVFLFNTVAGLRDASPVVLNNLKLMGASRWQSFRLVMLPTLASWHLGALRISLGLSLTAVIVGEFVAARGGVGFLIQYGAGTFNVTWCYAGIIVLALIVMVLDTASRLLQRWLMPWDTRR